MIQCCRRVAAEGPGTIRNNNLSRMVMESKYADVMQDRARLRLAALNEARRTHTSQKGVTMYQRFAQCLATRDVKRVRQIIAAELKRGSSVTRVTDLMNQAAEGVYSRKNWEAEENDFCVFLLLVGGGRIAESLSFSVPLTLND
eukprot:GHVU01034889.1.p1 GENE.GHVU01034889.1~~GHVU01034889.1.p1  ORF type:complete len:144 (+),score=16.94 GHVU01034889.1:149-580(+)